MILLAVSFSVADRDPVSADAAGRAASAAKDDRAGSQDAEAARRLAWIVAGPDRSIPTSVYDCLALGADCPTDAVLELDTARLRSGDLAAALTAAIDPTSNAYIGRAGAEADELARRTAGAAREVFDGLGAWMASGCGGNLDEIVTLDGGSAPPPEPDLCRAAEGKVREQLQALEKALHRWPAP